MCKNIDYTKLAIKLVEKVVKVIKQEVIGKDKKSKEKDNGKIVESSN